MDTIAAYVSVPPEEESSDDARADQRERIEDWAAHHDVDDVTFYEDVSRSGDAKNRETYDRLMAEYEAYDAVVVARLSRFGDDPVRLFRDVHEIVESETEFVSIAELFDSSSTMGEAHLLEAVEKRAQMLDD